MGDGNTQGGGSYLLDGSDMSPPLSRRTASGSDELLAPRLAEQDARLDKLETAVSGLADGQQETQQQLQASTASQGAALSHGRYSVGTSLYYQGTGAACTQLELRGSRAAQHLSARGPRRYSGI